MTNVAKIHEGTNGGLIVATTADRAVRRGTEYTAAGNQINDTRLVVQGEFPAGKVGHAEAMALFYRLNGDARRAEVAAADAEYYRNPPEAKPVTLDMIFGR